MSRGARKPRKGPAVWTIVLIDQGPLRRGAAADCQRQMRRLETARADWKHFEDEDRPAFQRWMASTFGPMLTELREIGAKIHEREMLVEEVEAEMFFRGCDYARAYHIVRLRHEQRASAPPPSADQRERAEPEPEAPQASDFSEFEQELLFEEYVSTFLGMDPDRLGDTAYRKMFAEFKAKLFGSGTPPEKEPIRERPPEDPKAARVKELYRALVRRLHPDTRADSDAQVSALWHEVQEAYNAGNVERLEMLLAMTDIKTESAGEQTTLGQLRAVLTELRRSLHALLRSLSAAKRELAWNFSRHPNRPALEQKLRRQMERDVSVRKQQLSELEAFIESWSAPRRTRKRSAKRKARAQDEFSF